MFPEEKDKKPEKNTEGLPDDVTIYHLSLKNKTTGLESQKQLKESLYIPEYGQNIDILRIDQLLQEWWEEKAEVKCSATDKSVTWPDSD